MKKVKILYLICSVLQIVGLMMIICDLYISKALAFLPILIGIAGFAAFVKLFLLERSPVIDQIAAVAGLGIIFCWCATA